jgi:hypothetical protein
MGTSGARGGGAITSLGAVITVAALSIMSAAPAGAQWWLDVPDKVPRTDDGEANLMAPAPRLADGTPDLSGIWF